MNLRTKFIYIKRNKLKLSCIPRFNLKQVIPISSSYFVINFTWYLNPLYNQIPIFFPNLISLFEKHLFINTFKFILPFPSILIYFIEFH